MWLPERAPGLLEAPTGGGGRKARVQARGCLGQHCHCGILGGPGGTSRHIPQLREETHLETDAPRGQSSLPHSRCVRLLLWGFGTVTCGHKRVFSGHCQLWHETRKGPRLEGGGHLGQSGQEGPSSGLSTTGTGPASGGVSALPHPNQPPQQTPSPLRPVWPS